MLVLLLAASIYFSIIDIRTHRIPNKSLLVFLIILITLSTINNSKIHWITAIAALNIGLLLSIYAGLGFGDVKLLVILTLFFLPGDFISTSRFIAGICISSALIMLITLFKGGNSRDSMAFAPCLFAGAILCASLP